jgi:hypothetical protein
MRATRYFGRVENFLRIGKTEHILPEQRRIPFRKMTGDYFKGRTNPQWLISTYGLSGGIRSAAARRLIRQPPGFSPAYPDSW